MSFRLDREAKALIAIVAAETGTQTIDEAWLKQHLAALGYDALRYLPSAAIPLLAHYNSGSAFEIKVAECVDASAKVIISPDGLEAYLEVQPAEGGASLDQSALLTLLAEHGIGAGVLPEALETAVAAGAAGRLLVARGVPPQHGRHGYLESLIPEARDRTPRIDETDHTDYRDLGDIIAVHPGDSLMLLHAPTEGTPGMTLHGVKVEAKPGKPLKYAAKLPGTEISPDNPALLLATITGQPVIVRGGMMVEPVYKANAVNTASGNIKFEGSVVIRGDVSAGMTVSAVGDIEIGGVVDMATLEAGGNIVVKGGVIGGLGRKGHEEHRIHCEGSFNAAYVQQACISAGDSIFIDDVAMQCELTAINHISVGNKKRGHIIGGNVQATLSITAKVIGSPNRVRTRCQIGVNPVMQKQLLEMNKNREARESQLLEVSKLLDFARKNPDKVRPEMLDKARLAAASISADIAARREEQELLARKIELSQQSRVNAQQALHEGVEVIMGNQCYRVVGEKGPSAVGLGEHGLELLPL